MTIEYLGIRSDFTGSRNTINLMVRGHFPLSDKCKIVIERPGQNRPYLAEDGWQSNCEKCLIEVAPSGEVDFDLCLPLAFARYLDSEHNYKVELFELNDVSVGTFGMNWTPPPRIRAARSEPIPPAPVKVVQDLPEPEPEATPDQDPIIEEAHIEPYVPSRPRVNDRVVQKCIRCRGQIFSTFSVCPYCGTPVNKG